MLMTQWFPHRDWSSACFTFTYCSFRRPPFPQGRDKNKNSVFTGNVWMISRSRTQKKGIKWPQLAVRLHLIFPYYYIIMSLSWGDVIGLNFIRCHYISCIRVSPIITSPHYNSSNSKQDAGFQRETSAVILILYKAIFCKNERFVCDT